MRTAAEAVIELLARAYGKRRRFFAVERTEAEKILAAFLSYRAADDVDDVDAGEQVLNEALRNHGCDESVRISFAAACAAVRDAGAAEGGRTAPWLGGASARHDSLCFTSAEAWLMSARPAIRA